MAVLDNHIKRVNDKLQQLLKQYQQLQKENERLKNTVKKQEEESQAKMQQVEQLQMQVSILKTSAGQMNEADKKAFDKKINQYLKEIDKCITLLGE
jgi:chromosome segregation ATPase